jgi:azurin
VRALICFFLLATAAVMTQRAEAAEKLCKLQISGNDALQYDKTQLKIDADCTQVELTLKNVGTLPVQSMGHSWVLTKTQDMQAVLTAGTAAGLANNYVPTDKRVIAATKLVGGGQTTAVTFSTGALQKGGDYTYFCSFPGHAAVMKGKFVFG